MYNRDSRYAELEHYEVTDHRGRTVPVVPVPPSPEQTSRGAHQRSPGQRLDHLADRYLDDPAGFWRLCELNDVMLPEALTEADVIEVPEAGG